MLNTHISKTPKGFETGRYLSIDFLGTTHKLAIVTFVPGEHYPVVDEVTFHFPQKFLKCSLQEFLEYLAKTVEDFLTSRGLEDQIIHACLSLPFPLLNSSLKAGELIKCTKNFNFRQSSRVELVSAFQKVLDKKKVRVRCDALVNDCTAVLEACAVGDAECAASFILDAGVNASYLERISNIRRDDRFDEDARSVILNMELAGFGDGGCLRRFLTEFDKRVDRVSNAPGIHTFEKLVSGEHMAELVRQVLKLLTSRGQLFGGVWPASLRDNNSFPARFLCEIDRDPPHLFYSTEFVLREDLHVHNLTADDLHIVRYVCSAVTYRSACLSAAGMHRSCVLLGSLRAVFLCVTR
uniref:Phosphotransferase n=1 Tax=Mesocestoides corti TaxID=53468 RepID=A0A5K3EPP8_MESCO